MKVAMQENLLAFSNDMNELITGQAAVKSEYTTRLKTIKVQIDLLMQEKDPKIDDISSLILKIEDDINAIGLPFNVVTDNIYFKTLQTNISQLERELHERNRDLNILNVGEIKYSDTWEVPRNPWWKTVRIIKVYDDGEQNKDTQALLREMKPVIAGVKKEQAEKASAEEGLNKRLEAFMAEQKTKEPSGTLNMTPAPPAAPETPVGRTSPLEILRSKVVGFFSSKGSNTKEGNSPPASPKGTIQTNNPGTPPGSSLGSTPEGSPRSNNSDKESKPKL